MSKPMSMPISKDASSRIQSTQAKSGADMTSGGFAARAQGAADRGANEAAQNNGGGGGGSGGGGSGGGGGGAGGSGGGK